MLIDTHAHLNFNSFDKDRKSVIDKCAKNNVWVINVGTNLKTSQGALDLVEKFNKNMFSAIGLHPMNLDTELIKLRPDKLEGGSYEKEFNYEKYKKLASSKSVVAIGEIGLDYYWKPKTVKRKKLFKLKQKELLLKQLELARELTLPVIFHCRMAHQDLMEVLTENKDLRPQKAVAHSFVGDLKELKDFLNIGYYIGFNGIIFKKIEGINFDEIIKNTPIDRILIETDCPYLSPPQAESKRNEPIFVKYTAEYIAEIKKISFEEISKITTENAKKLFNI